MAYASCDFDATDDAGNILTDVQVEVRRESGALQAVYADREGTISLGSTFTVPSGKIQFFAPGNAYRITLRKGAYERVRRYVAIGLAAETDLTLATFQGNWGSEFTYSRGDYVTLNGVGLFISAVDDNLNNQPDDTTPGSTTEWAYYPGLIGPPGIGDRADVMVSIGSRPRPGEDVVRIELAFDGEFVEARSRASAGTASDGDVDFTLALNGTTFGTVTFDTSATGVVGFSGSGEFGPGDILTITAPDPRDPTLENISITLAADRSTS